ncbi:MULTISPECIES: polysaccharide biosynthesis tyrosine autokinase [unclassified Ruegeria]|uniref:GumC family protein n=1 Tax=unclassified Ruegeria TaxID=2625375 RepID=UPI001489DBFF|nr:MULTISPECIES: polysaccharide biosynthesis tyrosine autokinase [unclassified Ruegeria]
MTPEMQAEQDELGRLLGLLWAGKWLLAATTVLGLTLAILAATYVIKPVYQAETTLLLDPGSDGFEATAGALNGLATDVSAINTQIEILRSDQMMRRLAERMNLAADPEFNASLRPPLSLIGQRGGGAEDVAKALAARVSVTNIRNSHVLTLSARSEDAAKAAEIVNTLATLYMDGQVAEKRRDINTAVNWLSDRVVSLEQEIEQQDDAAAQVGAAIAVQSIEALAMQLSDTRARLDQLLNRQRSLQQRARRLEALADNPTGAASFEDELLQRQATAALAGDTKALHGFAVRVAELQNQTIRELALADRQANVLQSGLRQLEADYRAQTDQLAQLRQVERDARATELLHQTFLSRLKETALRRGLQTPDSRIISPAIEGRETAPNTAKLAVFGVLAGAVAGIATLLLRQAQQARAPTLATIEAATRRPVIGQLPKAPVRSRAQLIDYLTARATSPLVEAAHNLRTSLLWRNKTDPPKVILCSSCVPGEGKTTTAIILAHSLAGLSKRVLLVEADIRRLSFQHYFPENPKGGLVTALSYRVPVQDLIQRDARTGLDVLMGERSADSAADLFSSPEFHALFEDLRQRYDHIVIDCPPVLVVPDARVIGQSADAIMLTVTASDTNRSLVENALREFSSVNLQVRGLVMSRVSATKGAKTDLVYGTYGQYYDTV